MCHHGKHTGGSGYQTHGCGCECTMFPRHFISSKEKKEMLENYKDQLQKELQGIEECIKKCECE